MKAFRDLKFSEVQSNTAGIRSISFLAKKTDIQAFPTIAVAEDGSANVTLDGDYVMKTGKTFVQVYTRKGTGKVSFEVAGPKDGKFFNLKAELDYPDINDDAMDLASKVINADCVLVVGTRTSNSNTFTFVVLGDEMFSCDITPSGSSGTLDSPDDKGLKLEASASSNYALPRYTGTIKTAEGTFDCETGTFTPPSEAEA